MKYFPIPRTKDLIMRFSFLSICLLIVILNGRTQNSPGLKNFMLPSPTASALGKYGEISVGMYTGIPSIAIPIYTIKADDIELPISLSYHAGGIKLEERASNVGIGWSLNAGGVITRSIRGLPDPVSSTSYYQSLVPLAKKYPLNLAFRNVYNAGNAMPTDVSQLDALSTGTIGMPVAPKK